MKNTNEIMHTKNVMIVGVGGQGSLLASKLLGRLLLSEGLDVKVSEVHGMSQRGGSVVTYVRYGEHVYSPVIDEEGADFIVSFELLEAARWLPYLKRRSYRYQYAADRSDAGDHGKRYLPGGSGEEDEGDGRQSGCA